MTRLWTFARTIAVAVGVLLPAVGPAWGGTAVILEDAELEQIDAGAPVADDRLGSRRPPTTATTQQTLSGAAQQAASALILVNSVASTVTAQVNLIVNTGVISHASQANAGATTR